MVKHPSDEDTTHAEPLLTAPEAAKRLHISRSLLYKLIREGTLPVVRLGGALRFRPEDVEALREPMVLAARRKRRKKKGTA